MKIHMILRLGAALILATSLTSGCVTKVVTKPVKAAVKTTGKAVKATGKTIYKAGDAVIPDGKKKDE